MHRLGGAGVQLRNPTCVKLPVLSPASASAVPLAANARMLAGIRVVELATVVAGPTCASFLSDMGADVIKVEPPLGDSWRTQVGVNPQTGKDFRGEPFSSCFENANRGKRSVVIDLTTDKGTASMLNLIGTADVFLTNMRLQALQKLGLGWESLRLKFPVLIFAHLTAWGVGGPKENDAGYDVGAFWAASGLQKFIMADDEPGTGTPRFVGGIGDHVTAVHLMAGVLGALYQRRDTGEGQYVEACLYRAGVHAMAVPMMMALVGEVQGKPYRKGPRSNDTNPSFNVYRCKDHRWIQLLGLETPRHLPKLLRCLGLMEHVAADARFAPVGQDCRELISRVFRQESVRVPFVALLDEHFATRDVAEWEAIFSAEDVWCHRMSDINEVIASDNAAAVGSYVDVPGVGHRLLAHPVKWSASPTIPRGRAPGLGDHTKEVLDELRRSKL